jgi:hypothetical protein
MAGASTGPSPTMIWSPSTVRPRTRSASRAMPAIRSDRPGRPLPDASDPADLHGQGLRGSPCRHAIRGARDTASAQFGRSPREASLLRKCELHPDLSSPGEIRRDRAPDIGREERRGAPCTNHGHEDRSRRGREPSQRSASSVGTTAKAWPPARSSCSRHMRSRSHGCCCTRTAKRGRTASPTAPTRLAAI